MTTLFDLELAVARRVGTVFEGVATGGSTTTLVDTAGQEPTNFWNGGTLFFSSGNNASKTAKVASWALTTWTYTFATLGACAAGNVYTVCSNTYPLQLLRAAVNLALSEVGKTLKIDSTLTGDGTDTLALPAGVHSVCRVVVDDEISFHWKEVNGSLKFDYGFEPADDTDLDVWYIADHAAMTADTDTLDDGIPAELIVALAAYYAVQLKYNGIAGGQDPTLKDRLALAAQEAMQARLRHPALRMNTDPHHGGW